MLVMMSLYLLDDFFIDVTLIEMLTVRILSVINKNLTIDRVIDR